MSGSPYDSPRPERDGKIEAHRLLAAAVIEKAVSDAMSRGGDRARRRDAQRFLHDADGALSFWLQVLDVDEEQVRGLIARVLENGNGNGRTDRGRLLEVNV